VNLQKTRRIVSPLEMPNVILLPGRDTLITAVRQRSRVVRWKGTAMEIHPVWAVLYAKQIAVQLLRVSILELVAANSLQGC